MSPELKARASYSNGTPSVTESKGGILFALGVPTNQLSAGEPLALFASVGNQSAPPFNFGPENITVSMNGKPLKVFTWEELRAREISKSNWQAAAVAMSAAGQSLSASMPRTTYESGNVYGSASSPYYPTQQVNYTGSYSGTTTTYDPARSALAQSAISANANASMASISATRDAALASLNGTLRTTTVHQGEVVGGLIRVKVPKPIGRPLPVQVTVTAAGQVFSYSLTAK